MAKLHTALEELGLSDSETAVYLALNKLGEAKASAIAKKAGLSRTTAISILARLEGMGFVSTHKYKGVIYYWVESPSVLKSLFESKIAVVDDLSVLLTDAYRSESSIPTTKYFDSKAAVRSFIIKEISVLPKGDTILTIDSPKIGNYQKVFSDEYYFALLSLKEKRKLATLTLVPTGTAKQIDPEKIRRQNISLRELPAEISFQASLWIMGNKLYLFSGTPPFVVMVKQEAIIKSMTSLFEYFWKTAEK